jgi:hypothetical protein
MQHYMPEVFLPDKQFFDNVDIFHRRLPIVALFRWLRKKNDKYNLEENLSIVITDNSTWLISELNH